MRQVDYYTNAARYLGFIERARNENNEVCYFLTSKGNNLFELPIKERQIQFSKSILSHLVFNRVLSLYFNKAEIPTKSEIVMIMKDCNLYHIDSDDTFKRRASTIFSWINWILDLVKSKLSLLSLDPLNNESLTSLSLLESISSITMNCLQNISSNFVCRKDISFINCSGQTVLFICLFTTDILQKK